MPTDRKGKTKEIKGKFPLFADVPTTPKKAKRLRTLKNTDVVTLHSAKGLGCPMFAKEKGCTFFRKGLRLRCMDKAKRLRTLKNADVVALHSAKGLGCKMFKMAFGCLCFRDRLSVAVCSADEPSR